MEHRLPQDYPEYSTDDYDISVINGAILILPKHDETIPLAIIALEVSKCINQLENDLAGVK